MCVSSHKLSALKEVREVDVYQNHSTEKHINRIILKFKEQVYT